MQRRPKNNIYFLTEDLYRHVYVANIDQNTGTNSVLVKCLNVLPATNGDSISMSSFGSHAIDIRNHVHRTTVVKFVDHLGQRLFGLFLKVRERIDAVVEYLTIHLVGKETDSSKGNV